MTEQKLEAIVRKFVPRRGMTPGGTADYVNIPGGHPDFEFENARTTGAVKGIVKSTLRKNEEDGLFKPQYSGQSQGTVSSEASFNQWFTTYGVTDTSYGNSEQKIILPLAEKAGQPGVFEYSSEAFFPLDEENLFVRTDQGQPQVTWLNTEGFEWRRIPTASGSTSLRTIFADARGGQIEWRDRQNKLLPHTYHFTLELHHTFAYKPGAENWTFEFRGDDDLWVFIAGKLVIDLGGVHSSLDGRVRLGDLKLNDQDEIDPNGTKPLLEFGKEYSFDLFYAERHTSGARFRITTSIPFDPKVEIEAGKDAQEPAPGQVAVPAQMGEFTVRLTGDKTSNKPLVVSFQTSGQATIGTGAQNNDYRLKLKDANGNPQGDWLTNSVTIPSGQKEVKIAVVPFSDEFTEEQESVILTLIDGLDYDLADKTEAEIKIIDFVPPLPVVTIRATIPEAKEPAPGQAALPEDMGEFTIRRVGQNLRRPLTVKFRPPEGTATLNTDYRLRLKAANGALQEWLAANSVIIPAGQSEVRIAVVPVGDRNQRNRPVREPDETVILTLNNDPAYQRGRPLRDEVVIKDYVAPSKPIVTLRAIDDEAEEPAPGQAATPQQVGAFLISVRSAVAHPGLTVRFRLSGDARRGSDYVLKDESGNLIAENTLAIAPGKDRVRITVVPLADRLGSEGYEYVIMTLLRSTGYDLGREYADTVRIKDRTISSRMLAEIEAIDDSAEEPFIVNGQVVEPGDNGTFQIRLSQKAPSGGVTVHYAISGTTERSDGTRDFVLDPNRTWVHIPEGKRHDNIVVRPIADTQFQEATETVRLTLQPGSKYFLPENKKKKRWDEVSISNRNREGRIGS
ncbi:fibro-slime domain-containing protein [Leptolyngbya sp. FACHB-541]|uniref:fibro-slime domain-containing protein n=1 Tax=Leptolyngbya sp. FACHB-541 TaxID=2692810 RepID=UPI0016837C34|nr:fibro-slime domain-containing protein [Leptolyngbya sp. FACHB-541]MBD1996848.1 fibro-slime domain-containing protein [Leptolyngbya sp. FACHB-541]